MIKVEVTEIENKPEFPRLYQSLNNGRVVLFTSKDTGVTIRGSLDYELGDAIENVSSCSDPFVWQPFHGTITLTQE